MRQPVRLFTRIVTIAALLAASSATQAQPTETEGEEIEPLGAAEEGRAWEAEQQEQEFEPVGPVEEEQKRLAEKEEAEEAEREEAFEGLEEIVVTATKRAEASQDVPISLTALSGRTLKDAGLTEFSQLDRFVPNLKIAPATDTRSTSIRIRGIGSVGTNAGIDPSVGVFIDGVYQGRAGMSVGDLLDIERIEVLRGPQGTLFGKNTAAGAISIVTKRPTYEWETFLETVVGNYNNLEFRGSLNIPIVEERVAARIAGYKVSRDGYDTNLYNGEKVNNNRKYGVRGKFVFDIDEEWSLLISGDFSEQNDTNFVADIISYEGESLLRTNFDRLSRRALNLDENPAEQRWQDDQFEVEDPLPAVVDPFDRKVWANIQPKNFVRVGGVSVDTLWEHDDHSVRWLNAYRNYLSDSEFDGDFSDYDAVRSWVDVGLHQFSSEATWTSPQWDTFEATGGLYFFYSTMHTVDLLGQTPFYVDRNQTMSTCIPRPSGECERTSGVPPEGIRNTNDNTHDMMSIAGYSQGTYSITDTLSFTGGLRLTHERKRRYGISTSTWKGASASPPVGGDDVLRDASRSATNVQGRAAVRYFPVEDIMLYASFGNGFKSGGFNQVRTNDLPDEFDDEMALSFEIGTKTSWFENRMIANLTLFFTDYNDFQSQTFDGANILVRNAGRLQSWGLESELVLMPVEELQLGINFAFNIAEYKSFDRAEATIAQQVAEAKTAATWNDADRSLYLAFCNVEKAPEYASYPGEKTNCSQDLAGKVLDQAPRVTFNVFANYEIGIPRFPVVWFTRADWAFSSEYYLAQDLEPDLMQQSFHLLNLRTGLRSEDGLWELTAWINNVTDSDFLVAGFDTPTVSGFAGVNGPPRYYGGTVRVNF